MKTITSMMIVALISSSLGGCIIRTTHHSHQRSEVRTRGCPPAHHWDGRACVHNGRAKGHYK